MFVSIRKITKMPTVFNGKGLLRFHSKSSMQKNMLSSSSLFQLLYILWLHNKSEPMKSSPMFWHMVHPEDRRMYCDSSITKGLKFANGTSSTVFSIEYDHDISMG
jgi:hypothetical protein